MRRSPRFPCASDGRLKMTRACLSCLLINTSSKQSRKRWVLPQHCAHFLALIPLPLTHCPRLSRLLQAIQVLHLHSRLCTHQLPLRTSRLEHSPATSVLRAWRYVPSRSDEGMLRTGQKVRASLYTKRGLQTSHRANTWSVLNTQGARPHSRPTPSEAAFQQDLH